MFVVKRQYKSGSVPWHELKSYEVEFDIVEVRPDGVTNGIKDLVVRLPPNALKWNGHTWTDRGYLHPWCQPHELASGFYKAKSTGFKKIVAFVSHRGVILVHGIIFKGGVYGGPDFDKINMKRTTAARALTRINETLVLLTVYDS